MTGKSIRRLIGLGAVCLVVASLPATASATQSGCSQWSTAVGGGLWAPATCGFTWTCPRRPSCNWTFTLYAASLANGAHKTSGRAVLVLVDTLASPVSYRQLQCENAGGTGYVSCGSRTSGVAKYGKKIKVACWAPARFVPALSNKYLLGCNFTTSA